MFDTICAISTPQGSGGIGIVRVSGCAVTIIAEKIIGFIPPPRVGVLCSFYNHSRCVIDTGIVLFYKKPASYTGEDVIEFHCHGSGRTTHKVLEAVLYLGVRQAIRGEFSTRAYLNKKINLLQVDIIESLLIDTMYRPGFNQNLILSNKTFTTQYMRCIQSFLRTLYVKFSFFITVDDDNFSISAFYKVLCFHLYVVLFFLLRLSGTVYKTYRDNDTGIVYILGQVNVGKSSLINSICGKFVSIVTKYPGTTRDLVKCTLHTNDMLFSFVDTVGFNFNVCDKVELLGLYGLRKNLNINTTLLNNIVFVYDCTNMSTLYANRFYSDVFKLYITSDVPIYIVINKIDSLNLASFTYSGPFFRKVFVSAKNKSGLLLLTTILACKKNDTNIMDNLSVYQKYLLKCISYIETCIRLCKSGEYSTAEKSLENCYKNSCAILGDISIQNIESIFSRFCVGK
jgi:tRNA modification GTPase